MLVYANSTFLLASPDPALLAAIEPMLVDSGARVEIVLSAEAALSSIAAPQPPSLVLLDANLPGMDPRMNLDLLLAKARTHGEPLRVPIILIADTVTPEWLDRLATGVIDDLILRTAELPYWKVRLEMVIRSLHKARELEALRDAIRFNAQMDRLTGIYNRETLLAILFRETDRAQRMRNPLAMVLFDIDDFGHWNSRLGSEACDDLLCQVVTRTARLLRSYDLFGRPGLDEFLVALPGCAMPNAVMLAERLRLEVFSAPFRVGGESVRLSACFGVTSSQGRSPVVVLREAEQALQAARATGPESIQCFNDDAHSSAGPISLFSPSAREDASGW